MEPTNDSFRGWFWNWSVVVPQIGWWVFECHESNAICQPNPSSEVYLTGNHTWIHGPTAEGGVYNGYFPGATCIVQLNETFTMVTGGTLSRGGSDIGDGSSIADVVLFDWTSHEWRSGPPLQSPRRFHTCTSLGPGRVMVAGGTGLFAQDLVSVEIYDSALDSWYYSEDLPEDGEFGDQENHSELFNMNGNPVWINGQTIWMFKEGYWIRLDSEISFSDRKSVV